MHVHSSGHKTRIQGDAGNGINAWWTSMNTQKRALDITGAAHWRVFVCTISWNIFIWDHLGSVPNIVSFRSWEKKKSISDHIRDRKLAATQIRLPTFDKWKWANLVYPSNDWNPIHSSCGYQNTRSRAREGERRIVLTSQRRNGRRGEARCSLTPQQREARHSFSTPLLPSRLPLSN